MCWYFRNYHTHRVVNARRSPNLPYLGLGARLRPDLGSRPAPKAPPLAPNGHPLQAKAKSSSKRVTRMSGVTMMAAPFSSRHLNLIGCMRPPYTAERRSAICRVRPVPGQRLRAGFPDSDCGRNGKIGWYKRLRERTRSAENIRVGACWTHGGDLNLGIRTYSSETERDYPPAPTPQPVARPRRSSFPAPMPSRSK